MLKVITISHVSNQCTLPIFNNLRMTCIKAISVGINFVITATTSMSLDTVNHIATTCEHGVQEYHQGCHSADPGYTLAAAPSHKLTQENFSVPPQVVL